MKPDSLPRTASANMGTRWEEEEGRSRKTWRRTVRRRDAKWGSEHGQRQRE